MTNLVSITPEKLAKLLNVNLVDFIGDQHGSYRVITKCRAGFYTVQDEAVFADPIVIINSYKKGAIASIEFKPFGRDYWFTVFAMKGKKCMIMDKNIFTRMQVGTVNQMFFGTNLYNQNVYKAVNATNWASLAFAPNFS